MNPAPYKRLWCWDSVPQNVVISNFFMISVMLLKMSKHTWFHLSVFQTVAEWRNSTVVTKLWEFIVLGDAVSTLETFVWILNHVLRSTPWSLFTLRAWNLVKWLIFTWSFCVVVSVYRSVKIWNSPQFTADFGMAYYEQVKEISLE